MDGKYRELPFCVVRNSAKTLVEQTFDGLKSAILCGYYKPGDVLPPMRVFVEKLGVSRIVTNEVIARLKAEGLVNARPRVGCVVLGGDEKLWKGRVLVVNPVGDDNYYNNVLSGIIRDTLIANGYLYFNCVVPQLETRDYDLSTLEHLLQRSIDLVVLASLNPEIVDFVAKFGVPYVTVSQFDDRPFPARKTGGRIDWNAAVADFVRDIREAGIRRVEQMSWVRNMADAVPALEKAKISARRWDVAVPRGVPRIQAVKEAGYREMARRLAQKDPMLPELLFFADDRLAEGALLALSERGVRVPEDLSVVSWSNVGSGPVFVKPLTRMEMDPYADGRKVSKWILEVLGGRRNPPPLTIGPRYRIGETVLKGSKES